MSQGAVFLLLAYAMFPALIIVALVVKLWQVRKALSWPSTEGDVIRSGVASHVKRPGDPGYNSGDSEVSNEPLVEYAYQVRGRSYRCQRITIGEKTCDTELEAILARYPVGASVTVYYNPAQPQTAVLERDLPVGELFRGVGCLLLFLMGGPPLAALLFFTGAAWLKSHVADADDAPFVAAAGGFGSLIVLFTLAFMRVNRQASKWPVTRGRIVSAGVEEYQSSRHAGRGRRRTRYKASVLYTYEVNGRRYSGDRVTMGVKVSAMSPAFAQRTAARYAAGSEVDVHYNPQNPGESVLRPHSRWHYLLWLIAACMFALAWAVASGTMER